MASEALKLDNHYNAHTAASYEEAIFYSEGEYMEFLRSLVRERMGVPRGGTRCTKRRILDLGGGTGNFTKLLVEGVPGMDAVCADPFLVEQTDDASSSDDAIKEDTEKKVHLLRKGADDILDESQSKAWWRTTYHQVLMKEVVHHIPTEQRVAVFQELLGGCLPTPEPSDKPDAPPLPAVLIMTRPQRDIDYPFFPAARDVWAANQPAVEDIEADLRAAGFKNVKHTMEPYKCEVKQEKWISMVKKRFWSTFSAFTAAELDEGCKYIAENTKPDSNGNIFFEDRMLYITAEI